MQPLLVVKTALGRRAVALYCVFLVMLSGAALAQSTGTVHPSPAPAEDVPSGGCMPIGLTASGEIVFPIQCKEFIERERGKTVEQRPADPEEKSVAKQPEAEAPESSKPADKPAAAAEVPPVRVERQRGDRARKSDDCTHYRTYNSVSGTYTGYDGRRRPCLERESYWQK